MLIVHGFRRGVEQGALGWLLLMGILYIIGAVLYAFRVPERFFPGKCDIMVSFYKCFAITLFDNLRILPQMVPWKEDHLINVYKCSLKDVRFHQMVNKG